MPDIIDLTGRRFGRLVVKHRINKENSGHVRWYCECDCGGSKEVRGQSLRQGRCKSCGCLFNESSRPNTLPEGEAALNALYMRYKRDAEKRELHWGIDKEFFRHITKQDCAYCGSEPSSVFSRYTFNGSYVYNGVDRVNSSVGYVEFNVVSCCSICNRMKSDMSLDKFLEHVDRISTKRKLK